MEIVAHRGASYDAPENTLASIRLGWEQGADVAEVDVRLSRDGQIVLIHDATTRRTAGADRPVCEQTFEELRALDAGSWKGAQWAGERIPTLEEALAAIAPGRRMLIEIKCGPEIMPKLARVVRGSRVSSSQVVLASFNLEVCRVARRDLPDHEVNLIASFKRDATDGVSRPTLDSLLAQAREARLHGLNVAQLEPPVDAAFVSRIHSQGLKVQVWTVDDAQAARRAKAWGVDSLTTNRPAYIRQALGAD